MILFSTNIKVVLYDKVVEKSSVDLVPGDIIVIESHTKISCDCILVDGACVMNEAILTGESVPVNKTGIL